MKLVADERGRITSAELFRRGAAFNVENLPDGSIRIVELVERTAPVVKPIRTREGFFNAAGKVEQWVDRSGDPHGSGFTMKAVAAEKSGVDERLTVDENDFESLMASVRVAQV